MNSKDEVKVKRGPLSGMSVILKRHDNTNRCWHATVSVNGATAEAVVVYDYELVDIIEKKKK